MTLNKLYSSLKVFPVHKSELIPFSIYRPQTMMSQYTLCVLRSVYKNPAIIESVTLLKINVLIFTWYLKELQTYTPFLPTWNS